MSLNPERYKFLESRTQEEEDWTAREALFNAHGYKFRPRLRKDWTPSWHTTGNNPLHSEDGQITKVLRSPTRPVPCTENLVDPPRRCLH